VVRAGYLRLLKGTQVGIELMAIVNQMRTNRKIETKFKQNNSIKELETQTTDKYGRVYQMVGGMKGQVLRRQKERLDVVVLRFWTDDELSQATSHAGLGLARLDGPDLYNATVKPQQDQLDSQTIIRVQAVSYQQK
jgi:hypothetical protein